MQDLHTTIQLITQKLIAYLTQSREGEGKVLVQQPPAQLAASLDIEQLLQNGGLMNGRAGEFLDAYLANTQHMHHPHYLGHQVAVPHWSSGIADLIHGLINNPTSIYEMGPAGLTLEAALVNWMLQKTGWFKGAHIGDFSSIPGNGGGVLVHGGSLANLTALSIARSVAAPEAWTEGHPANLVIMAPEVSHYSIARAVSIMGMGKKAIIPIRVNSHEVMQADDLYPAFRRIKENGQKVMALVANACATTTGLYDPIDEIAGFCRENNIWFHVDAAHGGCALLSPTHRRLLRGIEKADSLIWDMHKMMQCSALCAAVLVKDAKHLHQAFRQKGSYLFFEREEAALDTMPYTIECTKSALGAKLFWVLASRGEAALTTYTDSVFENTRLFYEYIKTLPGFECPYPPQSNILCFRYTKISRENDWQLRLRNQLVKQGDFYITSAEMNGIRYLRITVMNELTGLTHIRQLTEEIIKAGELM